MKILGHKLVCTLFIYFLFNNYTVIMVRDILVGQKYIIKVFEFFFSARSNRRRQRLY